MYFLHNNKIMNHIAQGFYLPLNSYKHLILNILQLFHLLLNNIGFTMIVDG